MKLNFLKSGAVLALGLFVIGFAASNSIAGVKDAQLKNKSGVVYEKPACPEGQDWNEETKVCEAKQEK